VVLQARAVRVARCACYAGVVDARGVVVRAVAAWDAAHVLGLAFERVVLLLAAVQGAAFVLELGDAEGWQLGRLVVLGCVVVDFVDGDCGVDYLWLDGFLVQDRLDRFVDVLSSTSETKKMLD